MTKKRTFNKKITYSIVGIITLLIIIIGLDFNQIRDRWDWMTLKPKQELNVPLENQFPELPNGCEVTSLSMLLNYYDIKVNKLELAQNIDHVPSFTNNGKYRGNPHVGFVGHMTIANAGWCVSNEPLQKVAQKYTNRIRNFSGHDFVQVMKLVSNHHPVLIITTTTFNKVNDMQTWQTAQGTVHVTPSSHACVITGYDKKTRTVYVNNPFGVKNEKVKWNRLESSYNQQGKQALYIP